MNISISHYTVHINRARALRQGVYGSKQGQIAAVMEPMGNDCPREKTTGGWYAAAEVTSPYSPIIIEITANTGGKAHAVRTVYSPPEMFGAIQAPAAAQAIFQAIRKATETLAEHISADIR